MKGKAAASSSPQPRIKNPDLEPCQELDEYLYIKLKTENLSVGFPCLCHVPLRHILVSKTLSL